MSSVARFNESNENGRRVLHLHGDLTLSKLGVLPTRLDRLKGKGIDLDLAGVKRMDTIGAWLVHRTGNDLSPAWMIMAAAAVSLLCLLYRPRPQQTVSP